MTVAAGVFAPGHLGELTRLIPFETVDDVLAATGAELLIRCKTAAACRPSPATATAPGSPRSAPVRVRVIDARIAVKTSTGTSTGDYRLITTLLDPRRHPAGDLITLYHQRGEIETAHRELKSSILGGRVLRARTPDGIDQEIHALLIVYQLLRTAMVDATHTQPGLDPDRASFTTASVTTRNQVIQAAGVITDTVIDLVGAIGQAVLDFLLPDRRIRVKARMIKRSNSKYQARGPNIDRRGHQATIAINIVTNEP